ncbi:MAG TPA: cytochrome c [Pyrinomonadaceae bacterium]|nr:cytochrome c [Pyrinomonadaceae bacterium]
MQTLKLAAAGIMTAFLISATVFVSATAASQDQFDAAGAYKAKCVACHGQKAEKKFNPSLTDQELTDAILNGKKPEKPPNMPAYGEKGITAEQAKALVDYMKGLKTAP